MAPPDVGHTTTHVQVIDGGVPQFTEIEGTAPKLIIGKLLGGTTLITVGILLSY